MEGLAEERSAAAGVPGTTSTAAAMEADIHGNQNVAPALAPVPAPTAAAAAAAEVGTAPTPAPAAGCRLLLPAAAQPPENSGHVGGVAAASPAAARVPLAAAAAAVPAGSTAPPAGGAADRRTGVTWRQADDAERPPLWDGGGAASDGAGALAVRAASGCVSERDRLKVAFTLPHRRSSSTNPGDPARPSPLAAPPRKRRRSWVVSKRVSCCRGPVSEHDPPHGDVGSSISSSSSSGSSVCSGVAGKGGVARLGVTCRVWRSDVGNGSEGKGTAAEAKGVSGVGQVASRGEGGAGEGQGRQSNAPTVPPVAPTTQEQQRELQQRASSFVVGPVSRFTALYFDEEQEESEFFSSEDDRDEDSDGDNGRASAGVPFSSSCGGSFRVGVGVGLQGTRKGTAMGKGVKDETGTYDFCANGVGGGGGGGGVGGGGGKERMASSSGLMGAVSTSNRHRNLSQQRRYPRRRQRPLRRRRQADGEAELLEVVEETRRFVRQRRAADQEALCHVQPACLANAKGSPRTPKSGKKPPLVIELLPTCWRVRTVSTEKLRHGDGHKKTANLQYCLASRQIMLDLDNNRFPVALMWALPEVMQEGGAVIAEIHDLRGTGADARDPAVATTLLQPFGEGVCPKGAHHPPGLGQGPGQGERFASDGSYIKKSNTAATAAVGNATTGNSISGEGCVPGRVAVSIEGGVTGAGGVTVESGVTAAGGSTAACGVNAARGADAAVTTVGDPGHQHNLNQRYSSNGNGDDRDNDTPPGCPLSIVVPNVSPLDSSPTSARLFPENRSPHDVVPEASPDVADSMDTSATTEAEPRTTTPRLPADCVEAISNTSGIEKETSVNGPPGDAGLVSPDRVPYPPPGSVVLVKPRVTRTRLKVNRGAWMATLWEEVLAAARKASDVAARDRSAGASGKRDVGSSGESGQNKNKRPKGAGGGKQLTGKGKQLPGGSKQPKGKAGVGTAAAAAAAAAATAAAATSPSTESFVGKSDGVNPWAKVSSKAERVGEGTLESNPVATAEALFGRGPAMEVGTKVALEAEALALQALVPPTDLCLQPSVDVLRLASMVRSDGGTDGETAKVFRFTKRHYRVLENLALPGAEDAPDEEQFFLGLGAKRLGKSTKKKLVESQSQISTAIRGGRPVVPASPLTPPSSLSETSTPPVKRSHKKQSQPHQPDMCAAFEEEGAALAWCCPSTVGGGSPAARTGGNISGVSSSSRSSSSGSRGSGSSIGKIKLSAVAVAAAAGAGAGAGGASLKSGVGRKRASEGFHDGTSTCVSTKKMAVGGVGDDSGQAGVKSGSAVVPSSGSGRAATAGARGKGSRARKSNGIVGSVLLGLPVVAVGSGGGGGGDWRSGAEMETSAISGWVQSPTDAAFAAAGVVPKEISQVHAHGKATSKDKIAKERSGEAKKRAQKQVKGDETGNADGDNVSNNGRAISPGMGPSLGTTTSSPLAAGYEDRKKKMRKSSVKSKKKLDEERALAFGVVHRTLLAPVTHLSPANGGRPHDPATFAKFAKPAQEKARAIDLSNWNTLARELARGSEAAAAPQKAGRLTVTAAENQLRGRLKAAHLAEEQQQQRQQRECYRDSSAAGGGFDGAGFDTDAKAIKTNPNVMMNLRASNVNPTGDPFPGALSPSRQHQQQHYLPQQVQSLSSDGQLAFRQAFAETPQDGFHEAVCDHFSPGLYPSGTRRTPADLPGSSSSPTAVARAVPSASGGMLAADAGLCTFAGDVSIDVGGDGGMPTPPTSPAFAPASSAQMGISFARQHQQQQQQQEQQHRLAVAVAASGRSMGKNVRGFEGAVSGGLFVDDATPTTTAMTSPTLSVDSGVSGRGGGRVSMPFGSDSRPQQQQQQQQRRLQASAARRSSPLAPSPTKRGATSTVGYADTSASLSFSTSSSVRGEHSRSGNISSISSRMGLVVPPATPGTAPLPVRRKPLQKQQPQQQYQHQHQHQHQHRSEKQEEALAEELFSALSWDSVFPPPLPPIAPVQRQQKSPSLARLPPQQKRQQKQQQQQQQQLQRTVVTPERAAASTPPGVVLGGGFDAAAPVSSSREQQLMSNTGRQQQQQQQLTRSAEGEVLAVGGYSSDVAERSPQGGRGESTSRQRSVLSRCTPMPAALSKVDSGPVPHAHTLQAALAGSIGGDSSAASFVLPDVGGLDQVGAWDVSSASRVSPALNATAAVVAPSGGVGVKTKTDRETDTHALRQHQQQQDRFHRQQQLRQQQHLLQRRQLKQQQQQQQQQEHVGGVLGSFGYSLAAAESPSPAQSASPRNVSVSAGQDYTNGWAALPSQRQTTRMQPPLGAPVDTSQMEDWSPAAAGVKAVASSTVTASPPSLSLAMGTMASSARQNPGQEMAVAPLPGSSPS